jgi:demethylmenaquinone methyltransferase/2-methoxy-6-polyprenyl-1,4-benzoquinol methylase
MLGVGRDRLLDRGLALPAIQFDAEKIPFPNNYFDVVSVAFGLRNMTHKDAALGEMARVIKAGGKVLVLEFSKPDAMIAPIYDIYSFKVLPWLGDKVAKDAASYQYLAESIRMHPDADALKTMMLGVGFDQVDTHRMTGGIVALHIGVKY